MPLRARPACDTAWAQTDLAGTRDLEGDELADPSPCANLRTDNQEKTQTGG